MDLFCVARSTTFWGFLITADEQQRPANEARIGKHITDSEIQRAHKNSIGDPPDSFFSVPTQKEKKNGLDMRLAF